MSKAVFGILLLFAGIFQSFTLVQDDNEDMAYTVTKLDSVNNWYFIYATRNDSTFKIVSMKNYSCDCRNIIVGRNYNFVLQKRFENVLSKEGLKLLPLNYSDIKGVSFVVDTDVFVVVEKEVYGLYSCKKLFGLCFVKYLK